MFDFHWPWMALLLLIPPLIGWLWPRHVEAIRERPEGQRTVLLHPALEHLRAAFQARTPGTPMSSVIYWTLLALLWIGLVLALMRPQWLELHTEVKTEGYDLMLTVDASYSMDALDFTVDGQQVSRMAVIKGVMSRFVANRRGDRVGLIIFGNQAYVLSPLTLDTDAVRGLLDGVVPSIAGQGTAMGDAMALGVKKLRERPQGSRVLVLITDGESTSGIIPPVEAAKLAALEGIRIYSIGVGSNQERVPIVENNQLVYRDDLGFDETVMKQVAEITGGAYFRATNTHALEEIYRRIDQLEKSEAEARSVLIPRPLYRWPLAFALLCLLTLGLFPDGRSRRYARG
jgi:Ca-activated chloride channel homolog